MPFPTNTGTGFPAGVVLYDVATGSLIADPATPGQLGFDPVTERLLRWSGTAWVDVGQPSLIESLTVAGAPTTGVGVGFNRVLIDSGTVTIPANLLRPGSVLRYLANVRITAATGTSEGIELYLNGLGGTVLTNLNTIINTNPDDLWRIQCEITVNAVGVAGALTVLTDRLWAVPGATAHTQYRLYTPIAIDLTTDFDLALVLASFDQDTTCVLQQLTVQHLVP